MADLTAEQLENIANQTFEYVLKGKILDQSIQDKPLLKRMREKQKEFPGGPGLSISGNVKFQHSVSFAGYSGDDSVGYGNPANVKRYKFQGKELHGGISVTHSELKEAGINVLDPEQGKSVEPAGKSDIIRITNVFQDKLEDMEQGLEESFNGYCWGDGSADPKGFAGLQSLVVQDPTIGVCGGIDRAAQPKWRNRSAVGASKLGYSRTNQTLTRKLRQEVRQLRRYGGRPDLILCGSQFLEALEVEVWEKGILTQTGFTNKGKNDIDLADISMKGVGDFMYDPTMDDLGMEAFSYFLDSRHISLTVMSGQDMVKHSPQRPADKYVLYRGVTWTGGMVADMLNCHGVYEVDTAGL